MCQRRIDFYTQLLFSLNSPLLHVRLESDGMVI